MPDGPTLREIGEHPFLERLCARLRETTPPEIAGALRLPVGDDCAIVAPDSRPLAYTVDALVEGIHFEVAWLSPREIGARAVAVSLSDIAAAAATPRFLLAAVSAPWAMPAADLEALLDGCAAAAADAGAALIGGNLTRGERLAVTVTAIGAIDGQWLARTGARSGDRLVVTGTLGGAAAAVACWKEGGKPAPELRARFARPEARVAAGRTLARAGARAAIDLSDGLLADLGHLCRASGVGARIERARLPRLPAVAALDAAGADFAATGGEDYEILVAVPPEMAGDLDALSRECGVALTSIGSCTEATSGVELVDVSGHVYTAARSGYDHFGR